MQAYTIYDLGHHNSRESGVTEGWWWWSALYQLLQWHIETVDYYWYFMRSSWICCVHCINVDIDAMLGTVLMRKFIQVELNPEKQQKINRKLFSRWLVMIVKVSTTDMCNNLTSIQVQERVVTRHAFPRLPHSKCMGKSLIPCKFFVKHLKEKILKY